MFGGAEVGCSGGLAGVGVGGEYVVALWVVVFEEEWGRSGEMGGAWWGGMETAKVTELESGDLLVYVNLFRS